jgi:hypothetical protein
MFSWTEGVHINHSSTCLNKRQNSHFGPSTITRGSISSPNFQNGRFSPQTLLLGSISSRTMNMIVLVLKLCILGSISFINYQSVLCSLNFYFQLNFVCVLCGTLHCCTWLAPTPPTIGDRKIIFIKNSFVAINNSKLLFLVLPYNGTIYIYPTK